VTVQERRVVVLVRPGVQALDVTGPVEVFDTVNRLLAERAVRYRIECVSADAPLVRTSSGMVVYAGPLADAAGPIDTLLVTGSWDGAERPGDASLADWVRQAAGRSRRIAAVSAGSLLLAEAGLLDGRRATTHWAVCDAMARRYPRVSVDPEPIFVRDGPYLTSAGVCAGIDLELALVEADHGTAFALDAARFLVVFVKRNGGQSQFSAVLDAQLADRAPLRETQEWILDNLERPLAVPELARRANLSTRHFSRVFREEVGATPARYVERMRIARARGLLEVTGLPMGEVARRCGFTTVETFLRSFGRVLGVSPGEYRSRFQGCAEDAGAAHRALPERSLV
jgi:transcriptional regulator GlxA family with amidase domain